MGNQLSPVLCDIAVTCVEQMWRATRKLWLANQQTSQINLFCSTQSEPPVINGPIRPGFGPELLLQQSCLIQKLFLQMVDRSFPMADRRIFQFSTVVSIR